MIGTASSSIGINLVFLITQLLFIGIVVYVFRYCFKSFGSAGIFLFLTLAGGLFSAVHAIVRLSNSNYIDDLSGALLLLIAISVTSVIGAFLYMHHKNGSN